jgi:GT2 family glycosyltransferase
MIKLAVITINHQHTAMIRKTIESLLSLGDDQPFQLFVINNLSDEDTKKWLEETVPRVRVLENKRPQGFAKNINNIIAGNPDFDYYLLLNPDVICLPGMLGKLIKVMEKNPQFGVAGPQLLDMDGAIQPSRRRFATFPVLIMRALHIDSLFKKLPAVDRYLMTDDAFDPISEVDWVTGAVMLLRKAALDEVGLLDEEFFMYFEDEDLCCRMWQKGWKVCYINDAKAYHAHIAEGRKKILSKANIRHISSAFKMLFKHGGKIGPCRNQEP